MIFQILMTYATFTGLKAGSTPSPIWVPLVLAVIWWRPAFKYGAAALAVFSLGALIYEGILISTGTGSWYRVRAIDEYHAIIVIGLPIAAVSSTAAFLHDAAIHRHSLYAYILSALCWLGWFAGALVGSELPGPLLGIESAYSALYVSSARAHVIGTSYFALPITFYYAMRALWTKKPQPTYSIRIWPSEPGPP
jgi:hypothetical protein